MAKLFSLTQEHQESYFQGLGGVESTEKGSKIKYSLLLQVVMTKCV